MGTAMLAANVASLRHDSELGAETKPGTRCENYVLLHAQTFVFLLFSHGQLQNLLLNGAVANSALATRFELGFERSKHTKTRLKKKRYLLGQSTPLSHSVLHTQCYTLSLIIFHC